MKGQANHVESQSNGRNREREREKQKESKSAIVVEKHRKESSTTMERNGRP